MVAVANNRAVNVRTMVSKIESKERRFLRRSPAVGGFDGDPE